MIKIYVQNKPLFLSDGINNEILPLIHLPDTFFVDELNATTVKSMLHRLEQPNISRGIINHEDLNELIAAFTSNFKVLVAAGGLVYTPEREFLLIFRKGKWDLPKGKLDEGETIEECAIREIYEETGATLLHIEKPIQLTYHTYYENEELILKESHWFLIGAEDHSVLTPQQEEDIEKCEWVRTDCLTPYRDNMHASIKDVLEAGMKLLQL